MAYAYVKMASQVKMVIANQNLKMTNAHLEKRELIVRATMKRRINTAIIIVG